MYERINIRKTSFLFVLFAFTTAENRLYSSLVILADTVTCFPFCAVHTLVHVGRLRPSILIHFIRVRFHYHLLTSLPRGSMPQCRRILSRRIDLLREA